MYIIDIKAFGIEKNIAYTLFKREKNMYLTNQIQILHFNEYYNF